ncbi:hypothetical protein sscle_07g056130 [Sclerotinia sclerotiorum 1980 UF-70]|uniref:Uncharacterized protein n=1 Tax=Sclerotinia sclerotiorum (strain ATCC 18683 / 1980 / Ss-1) TaxID=665079 RepID=A0A1D9Q8B8_SCLS1|nr:hypothetical protein sscle_07g056130 [Sclerotinia sclerotiorum 1980 UF-70]
MSEADSGRTRHSDDRGKKTRSKSEWMDRYIIQTWVDRLVNRRQQKPTETWKGCIPYKGDKAGHLQQALQADDPSPNSVVVERGKDWEDLAAMVQSQNVEIGGEEQ